MTTRQALSILWALVAGCAGEPVAVRAQPPAPVPTVLVPAPVPGLVAASLEASAHLRIEVVRAAGAAEDVPGTLYVEGVDVGLPALVAPAAHPIDAHRVLLMATPALVWDGRDRTLTPLPADATPQAVPGVGWVFVRSGYRSGSYGMVEVDDLDPETSRLRTLFVGDRLEPVGALRGALLVRTEDRLVLVRPARAPEPLAVSLRGWTIVRDGLRGEQLLVREALPLGVGSLGLGGALDPATTRVAVFALDTGRARELGSIARCAYSPPIDAILVLDDSSVRWDDAPVEPDVDGAWGERPDPACAHVVRVSDGRLDP